MDTCERLDDLLQEEIPALKEAIMHRMNLLEEEQHMQVPYHMAEKDFMNRFLNAWAEGYKMAYCKTGCPNKDNCKIGYRNLHQYQDYYKNKR